MNDLLLELRKLSNPEKIRTYKNFHKTGEGDYAHGEDFLGLTVPQMRKIAEKHGSTSLEDIDKLLKSKVHEEKYIAVLILIHKYQNGDDKIVPFCIKNTKKFTGWDLVDSIAPGVFGPFLVDKEKSILYDLARSSDLWEKRISIVSTLYFIRQNKFNDTLKITEILLNDKHDLIHKACGWMLREVGKRDEIVLRDFLKKHYKTMPRTMLRYAIERLSDNDRKSYLAGTV